MSLGFKRHKYFFLPFTLFLLLGIGVLLLSNKGDFYLLVNRHHCTFGDYFFQYITHLGHGLMYLPFIIIAILFFSYRDAIMLICNGIHLAIVINTAKRLIFPDALRPKAFFQDISDQLYFIDGLKINLFHSFPSGHTATAFSLATMLMLLYSKNRRIDLLLFILALLAGFSRIYLSQHFLEDVLVGSLIGVTITLITKIITDMLEFMSTDKLNKAILK